MKALVVALTTIVVAMTTGCASPQQYEAMRERAQKAEARVAELEGYLAGAQDDMGVLMTDSLRLQGYIRELEMGAAMQADYINRIRRNCDL